MSDRPILMSAPMIRALLEGRKSQTRRVLVGTTEHKGPYNPAYLETYRSDPGWADICPYGKRGDRLWAKETFHQTSDRTHYRADAEWPACGCAIGGWRPSIFMPRAASRITLEITDVRVQRAQEISEDDAKAEGIEMPDGIEEPPDWWSYRDEYALLWDAINGKRPGCAWKDNPFVWVIGLMRADALEGRE